DDMVAALREAAVKMEFDHQGGAGAPVTISELQSTTLKPLPTPTSVDYFPTVKGRTLTYRWTNTKHLRTPEVEKLKIDAVVNNTSRFRVVSAKGPIKAKGSYGYSKRVSGVTNLWGNTASASLHPLPPLGLRARRRRGETTSRRRSTSWTSG